MDIKNLLFNMLLAGLTSYIISNLFFYFVNKDKKNKYTFKEITPKENKPKEKKVEEKTEEEEHKESKEKIFDYFKNGVPYSEKEYEALNKFLDDLQLIGLKFLQHNEYIEVIKEYSSWDMYGYFDLYGFMRSVCVKFDRVKGCLRIDNRHDSNDYRYRVNCEKIQPLIDRFNKTMGYEEEVEEVDNMEEELEKLDDISKEEQIKNLLEQISKMDPKNEKGYLDLEEFIRGAVKLGYKVSLGKIYKTIGLEKINKKGKNIIIIVWFDPDKKELKLKGQIHEPYEIEKEMREVRELVQNFNNKVIINNTNSKEIIKEESNSEDTQKKYPSHYYINGRNTIEIIKDIVNKNAKTIQEGIDLFNVLKYLIRYRNKNKVDDLKKARNYLDWLIKEVEEQELSTLND